MGAAFTASADQDVKAWMVDMIASGDKEGYESEAQTTLYFDVRPRPKCSSPHVFAPLVVFRATLSQRSDYRLKEPKTYEPLDGGVLTTD